MCISMSEREWPAVEQEKGDNEFNASTVKGKQFAKRSESVLVDYNNLSPDHASLLATIDPRQDGSVKLSDVLAAVKKSNQRKKKLAISRKVLICFSIVALAQISVIIGLTYALLIHVKDTEVDGETNALIAKNKGSAVQTRRLVSTVHLSSSLPDHVLSRGLSLLITGPHGANITFGLQGFAKHSSPSHSNDVLELLIHDGRYLFVQGKQVAFHTSLQNFFEGSGFRTVQHRRDTTGVAGAKRRLEKGCSLHLQVEGEAYISELQSGSEEPDPTFLEDYFAEFTALFPCVRSGADHCTGKGFESHTKELDGTKYAISYGSLWVAGNQVREEYYVPTKTTLWKLVHLYEAPSVHSFQMMVNDSTTETVTATQCSSNDTGFSMLHEQSSFLSKKRLPESTFKGYETLENGDEVRHYVLEEEGITSHTLEYYEMKSEGGTYVPRRMILLDKSQRNHSNVIDFTLVQVGTPNISMHFPGSSCENNSIFLQTAEGQSLAVGFKTPQDVKEVLHGGLPFDLVVSDKEVWQAATLGPSSNGDDLFKTKVPGGYPFLKLLDHEQEADSNPLLVDQISLFRSCQPIYNSAGMMKGCVHLTSLETADVQQQNNSASFATADVGRISDQPHDLHLQSVPQCDFRTDVSVQFYFGQVSMSLPKPFTGGFLCKAGISFSGKVIPIAKVGGSVYMALRTDTEDWDAFKSVEVGGCVGITLGCSIYDCGVEMALSLSGCLAGGLREETVVQEWEIVEKNVVTYSTTNCADWEWQKYRQLCGNPDRCSFCQGEQHCCKLYCCQDFAAFTQTYMDPPKYCCHTYPHYEKVIERVPKKWKDYLTFYAKTAAYLQLGVAVFSFDMTVIPPLPYPDTGHPHRNWKVYFLFSSSVTNKLCILSVCQYTNTVSLGSSTATLDLAKIFDKDPDEKDKCEDAGPYSCLRLSEVEKIVREDPASNRFALRGGHCGMFCSYASGIMKCNLKDVSASTPVSFSFFTHGDGQKETTISTSGGRMPASCTDVGGDRVSCVRKLSLLDNESPNFMLTEISPPSSGSTFMRGGASNMYCSDKGPGDRVRCNSPTPSKSEEFCIVKQGSCTGNVADECPGLSALGHCASPDELFQAYTSNPKLQVTIQLAQCGLYCSHTNGVMKCDRCEPSAQEIFTLKMFSPNFYSILTSTGEKCYMREEDGKMMCDGEPGDELNSLMLAKSAVWETPLPNSTVYWTMQGGGVCTGSLDFETVCNGPWTDEDLARTGNFFDYLLFCISLL